MIIDIITLTDFQIWLVSFDSQHSILKKWSQSNHN